MTALRILSNQGATKEFSEEEVSGLAMALHGALLKPGDAGFDEAKQVYNGAFKNAMPGAIVRARSTADVVEAVRFAAKNDLVLAVRGGGHNVAGKSTCNGGLVIDLSQMNGVVVDRQSSTVTVQGGATWGDVDAEAQAYGLAVPGGVVSTTGVAGLTLNGGVGWLRNKYGLSCDNLIGAEVVTASGEVVTASESENPDLLWALRGGGGNFGVVTSFRFRAHPVGPMVAAAIVAYPLEQAGELLRKWRQWVMTMPDEVSAIVLMWTPPVSPHLPDAVHGKPAVIMGSVYAGDAEKGMQVMDDVRHFADPLADLSGILPYRAMQGGFDVFFPADGSVSSFWKSAHLNDLTDAAIDVLVTAGQNRTTGLANVSLWNMGGGVRGVAPEATAFHARSPRFLCNFEANWLGGGDGAEHITWSRRSWESIQPHAAGSIYLNFIGDDADAERLVLTSFGPNYERLVEVKTKYDPNNLFRLNQNVKPRA